MKAVVQDRYGETTALTVASVERPMPTPAEVLIRVHAAGVDPGVWHIMAGKPYIARLALGLRRPKTQIRGRDMAGVVVAVGSEVRDFSAGDEVFGYCEGSFAEFVSARVDRIAPKPSGLSFEQAAAMPISAGTALQAVRAGAVTPGQRVLVIGAAGGVGAFAVQIAVAMSARVTGVCSTAKVDLVLRLGAHDVIDYTRDDLGSTARGYDVIIDTAGHRSVRALRALLSRHGTLVIVGSESGGPLLGGLERPLGAAILSLVVRHTLRMLVATENAGHLRDLTALIDDGELRPVIDRVFPLQDFAQAIDYLRNEHPAGKVVILP